MSKKNKLNKKTTIILLVITILGGTLYIKFTDLLISALKNEIQINPEKDFTKTWQAPPLPIFLKVRVFSINNPEEFMRGAKAKLREYGPYVYDLKIRKDIISFSNDRKIVKFNDIQSFHYIQSLSKGSLRDRVYVLNFPVYAFASMVRQIISSLPFSIGVNPVVFGIMNLFFATHGEDSMLKSLTVGQLLNGYRFEVLDTMDELAKPLGLLGIKLPDTGMPDNKFGFLWTKNYTINGPYQTFTGQEGTNLLEMVSFKGQSSLDFYDTEECNAFNGSTEGSTLGLNVDRFKRYTVFTHDLCRSLPLLYERDGWVNGLKVYRFGPDPSSFAAPYKNPSNRCFCTTPDNEDQCDGVFDLTRCIKAPLAYSFPHFLYANRIIQNNVLNLRPNEEEHKAFAYIEPFTGSPLKGRDKVQINALLEPIGCCGFQKVRKTILPLLWLEKSAEIDDKFTKQLQMSLYPIYGIYIFIYILFFGGLILLTCQIGRWGLGNLKNVITSKALAESISIRSNSTEPLYEENPKKNKKLGTKTNVPKPKRKDSEKENDGDEDEVSEKF